MTEITLHPLAFLAGVAAGILFTVLAAASVVAWLLIVRPIIEDALDRAALHRHISGFGE